MYSQEQKDLLKTLIEAGFSIQQLAAIFRCSYSAMRQRILNWGFPMPQRPDRRPSQLAPRNLDMIRRYGEGQTLQQIGDAHGLTRERVRQLLREQGCSPRKKTITKVPPVKFKPTPIDKFWRQVDRRGPDECWPHISKVSPSIGGGHHYMNFRGQLRTMRQVSWFLKHKRWSTMRLGVTCSTERCVNPDHLFEATYKELFTGNSSLFRRNKLLHELNIQAEPLPVSDEPPVGVTPGEARKILELETWQIYNWERAGRIPRAPRDEKGFRICTPEWIAAVKSYRDLLLEINKQYGVNGNRKQDEKQS